MTKHFTSYKHMVSVFLRIAVSTDVEYESKNLHVTMIPNPSHLEASHPVIIGKARSRFLTRKQAYYNSNNTADSSNELNKILTIQVHGDAAIAGQVIYISLNTKPFKVW